MLAEAAGKNLSQMQEMARAVSEYGREVHERLSAGPLAALLTYQLGGVLAVEIALALVIAVAGFVLRWLLVWGIGSFLHKQWGRRESEWQDSIYVLLLRYVSAFVVLLALFFSCAVLTLPREPIDWNAATWRIYLSVALVWVAV